MKHKISFYLNTTTVFAKKEKTPQAKFFLQNLPFVTLVCDVKFQIAHKAKVMETWLLTK